MEDYSHLGVNSSSRGSFLFTSSALAPISAGYGRPSGGHSMMQQQPLPMSSFHHQPTSCFFSEASPSVKSEGGGRLSAHQQLQDFQYPFAVRGVGGGGEDHGHGPVHAQQLHGSGSSSEVDAIKAKIIAHPQYSSLLEAYVDCQKVGAPPEVAARLAAIGQEYEARQRATVGCRDPTTDPELDQFMEAYYDMLVKYREELTRPIQEATDFMKRIESQLNVLTNGSVRVFNSDEKCQEVGSSEEEQDGSGEETQVPDIDPRAEDRELKNHLLKKYSGYLGSLKQELSKKRKKGKLPKEARQKLLSWWELHYKWPYPSEAEKVALAESTGLDQKQINNWFINQRKRHWKPSEDMQFMVMDGLHPHGAAVYMDHGHFIGDASYRLGS